MSLASIFGRSSRWSLTVSEDFWPCLAALGGFFVSHWEKYITGVMYLPWLYDVLQVVCRREGGGESWVEQGGEGAGRDISLVLCTYHGCMMSCKWYVRRGIERGESWVEQGGEGAGRDISLVLCTYHGCMMSCKWYVRREGGGGGRDISLVLCTYHGCMMSCKWYVRRGIERGESWVEQGGEGAGRDISLVLCTYHGCMMSCKWYVRRGRERDRARERKRKGEGGREQGGISHDCNISYRVVVLAI